MRLISMDGAKKSFLATTPRNSGNVPSRKTNSKQRSNKRCVCRCRLLKGGGGLFGFAVFPVQLILSILFIIECFCHPVSFSADVIPMLAIPQVIPQDHFSSQSPVPSLLPCNPIFL